MDSTTRHLSLLIGGIIHSSTGQYRAQGLDISDIIFGAVKLSLLHRLTKFPLVSVVLNRGTQRTLTEILLTDEAETISPRRILYPRYQALELSICGFLIAQKGDRT
jgi:hypothetical protein